MRITHATTMEINYLVNRVLLLIVVFVKWYYVHSKIIM